MLKKTSVNHRYLSRFLLAVVLLLIMPLSIYLYFLLTHSYHELEKKNLQSYQKIIDVFASYMQNELSAMRNQAAAFSVRSRSEQASIPAVAAMNSNPYYYTYITDAIKSQHSFSDYNLLLYYKNIDSVFSMQYRYSRSEYILLKSNGNAAIAEAFGKFLDGEEQGAWRFMSTFPLEPLHNATFYIGIPIKVGVDYQEAMLIYMLAYNSINANMFSTQSVSGLNLMLFDEREDLLYTNMAYDDGLVAASGIFQRLDGHEPFRTFFYQNHMYSVFRGESSMLPFQCIALMENSGIEADTHAFYVFTRNLTLCMLAMLMLFVGIIIYNNYIPILQLLHRVAGQSNSKRSELETIEGEFLRMRDEIKEQNQLVIDSLISNLLYGAVVPKKLFEKTLFYEHSGDFCVFTVNEIRFDAIGRARLLERIKHTCGVDGYITDMLYEDFTVLICLLSDIAPEEISRQISVFIEDTLGIRNAGVYAGATVHGLNNIQHSYRTCLSAMNPHLTPLDNAGERDLIRKQLSEEVVRYIGDNLSSPLLSQTIVADHFSISTYSLSRLFREQIGIGFSEYVTGRRLDHAKRLLITTSMKISEVSQTVGIADAKYFSRIFKANLGITPNEFRHDSQREVDF